MKISKYFQAFFRLFNLIFNVKQKNRWVMYPLEGFSLELENFSNYNATLKLLDFSKSQKVLELGCGEGVRLITLATLFPEKNFIGVDISKSRLKVAKLQCEKLKLQNISFHEADVSSKKFILQLKKFDSIDTLFTSAFLIYLHPFKLKKLFELLSLLKLKHIFLIEQNLFLESKFIWTLPTKGFTQYLHNYKKYIEKFLYQAKVDCIQIIKISEKEWSPAGGNQAVIKIQTPNLI